MTDQGRRRILALGTTVVIAGGILPPRWRKPVVDAVLVPAHAQASAPASMGLASAGVDTRTPSGGTPTVALASLTVDACSLAGVTVTVAASAGLSPAGALDLGTVTATVLSSPGSVTLNVPATTVADIASISTITVTLTIGVIVLTDTVSGAPLTALLTGSSLSPACA